MPDLKISDLPVASPLQTSDKVVVERGAATNHSATIAQIIAFAAGGGDVQGPAGVSADGNVAIYDATTGKVIKDSLVNISPTGVITAVGNPITDASGNVLIPAFDPTGGVQDDIIFFDAGAWARGTITDVQVDLTTDVTGILPDANVADDLTIDGGTINDTPIGAVTPSTAVVTTLTSSGDIINTGGTFLVGPSGYILSDAGASSTNRAWHIGTVAASGRLDFAAVSDDFVTLSDNFMEVSRTGVSIDDVTFPNGVVVVASADINGGAIDGTTLGATTRSTARVTTLNANGLATLSSVDINGGNIDGTTIGASVAAAADFTTVDTTGDTTVGGDVTVTGQGIFNDGIGLMPHADRATVSIVSGNLPILSAYDVIVVDAEGGGTTDFLDTISGGYDGQVICLQAKLFETITINHLTGGGGDQIYLKGAAATLAFGGTGSIHLRNLDGVWHEI